MSLHSNLFMFVNAITVRFKEAEIYRYAFLHLMSCNSMDDKYSWLVLSSTLEKAIIPTCGKKGMAHSNTKNWI